jgi:hypothetical protein
MVFPQLREIDQNNEVIISIPKFDRWQEAELHIARYLDLMAEREAWNIEESHKDRMKENLLVTRLVDPEFKSVQSWFHMIYTIVKQSSLSVIIVWICLYKFFMLIAKVR